MAHENREITENEIVIIDSVRASLISFIEGSKAAGANERDSIRAFATQRNIPFHVLNKLLKG